MNNNKYLKLQNQFENTIDRICHSNGEFNKFLITAAHNFRFAFNNAVVTYAQAPDATALLTYDQWQLYGRVPKRYSKSILLFDNEMPGKYSVTFDYAKTTIDKRVQYPKTIKFFNYQSTPEVAGAIKLLYQVNTPSNLLSDILLNISKQNVDANTPADTTEKLRDLYSKVVTNMLCSRFTDIGTKGTFDAFMYQMVERKQRFISSIMTSKNISNRSAEDVDEATLNYGQIKAVASDNPIVLRKFEIDSEVTKLASIRNDFIENHRALEDEVEITLPNRIHSLEISAENYRADIEFAKSHKLDGDNFTVEIQGKNYDKRTSAVEALYASAKNIADNDIVDIGSYRGFRLLAYKEIVGNYFNLCLTVKNRLGYRLKLNPTAGIGNMIKLNNLLNVGIAERLKDTETTIIDLKHRLETAKEEIKREFPQENDYQQLLREQAKINAQLTIADNQNNGISPDGSQPSEMNSSSYKPKIRR